MARKILLIITLAAALLLTSCRNQTASAPNHPSNTQIAAENTPQDPCSDWEYTENTPQTDYEALTDLSRPGRYPWCEALDSYYQANHLWNYSPTDWRQMYQPLSRYANNPVFNTENAPLRADAAPDQTYYLANPEHWHNPATQLAGRDYRYPQYNQED